LKPAPFLVKDTFQQAERSTLPDLVFHHSDRTMAEDIGNCVNLDSYYIRPEIKRTITKKQLNVPDEAILIATSGRTGKFAFPVFWDCVRAVHDKFPNVYFLIIGYQPEHHPYTVTSNRILLPGFILNVFDVLQACDLFIDTFPHGGGFTVAEAVFAGLPTVVFDVDYNKPWETWTSTYPNITKNPDLTVPQWDYDAWMDLVGRLITNKEFRQAKSQEMKQRAEVIGDFEGYVRKREQEYLRLVGRA